FKPILERANKTSDLAASLKILRELPFGDFALLTLNVPQEYANLKQSLPQMASDEDQRQWTGGSGTGLLQQTVDFVKSVHLTMYETGLNHDIEKRKILDFGMGWGRIIRLMYWLFEPSNIFAVDPMQSSIDVCRENNVTAHIEKVNNIVTELPFEDKFDLIYAFSVFTHIAEASSQAAQQTLRRHITDDGLFVITVRPVEYWQFVGSQGQLTSEEVEELVQSHNTTGYSFKPHNNRPDELGGGLYGDCTYSLEYIEEHWPEWKIVKVDRNFSDYLQVYVYLQPV
ncbi:MAG: class I SAM-dependent methyltransferase, partial [Anaerolineae bacterium]|nr:class I SAM-dependent methyltransferase [Anaerolineae bacterium]